MSKTISRLIILALPCDGVDDAACVRDFIRDTGMTNTDYDFDIIPMEKYAEVTDAHENARVGYMNPSEEADMQIFLKDS